MTLINQTLQDRYRITHEIGEGGMGRVYRAEDMRLNQIVAIKEALSPSDESAQLIAARVRAFQREAHLLAGRIKHHAIPRVIDHFQIGTTWYIVMDYVDGESLEQQLKQRGAPFSLKEVLLWTGQLLKILESLHSGTPPIIHRDIKPSNIKVKDNKVCLLDFGLAKQLTGTKKSTVAMFTPAFAAPEQMDNREPTAQSDLYSVGATMYYLLSNVEPMSASERSIAIACGGTDPLPHLKDIVRTEIPDEITDLIMSAMSLRPDERPFKAETMRAKIDNVLSQIDNTFHPSAYEFHEKNKTLTPEPSPPASPSANQVEANAVASGPTDKESSKPSALATTIVSWPRPFANAARSNTVPKNNNRKRLIAGVALLLLIGAVTTGIALLSRPKSSPAPDLRKLAIEKTGLAMEKLYVNDYEGAKALAKQAFESDPTYALAYAIHGDAFWDEDETELEDSSQNRESQNSKLAIFKVFTGKEPVTAEEYAARGWAYLADKKWSEARKDIAKATTEKPDWAWALMQKGFAVYGKSGCPKETESAETREGLEALKKINSIKPNYAMAYMNLSSAYACNRQEKEAKAACDRAVELRQSPKFYVRRGKLQLNSIDDKTKKKAKEEILESARKDFQKALEKDPAYGDAHVGLARIQEFKQEYKECITEADKALSNKDSFDGYYYRSACRGAMAAKDKDEKGLDDAILDIERTKQQLSKYSDQRNEEDGWGSYYLQKSYLHEYKATYFLTEKYLKKKNSENAKKVMAELENAKLAADNGVNNIRDKEWNKTFKDRQRVTDTNIRKFKVFLKS